MVGVAARRSIEQIEKTSTIRPLNISRFEFFQNNSKQTRKARRTVDLRQAEFAQPVD
jgi:hypothetical protein